VTSLQTRLPGWLTGSGVIALGMGVMNVTNYGFTLLAARMLGPSQYGAVAALMGLMLVLGVISLGLQAAAARRISRHPDLAEQVRHSVVSASGRAGVVLALLTLASWPVLTPLLRLDGGLPVLLLAIACLPLTVMGGQAGILQGERRWLPLALMYVGVGVGRIGFGVLGMWWRPDVVGAMLGVTVGAFVPVVVGWVALHARHAGVPADALPPVPALTGPEAAPEGNGVPAAPGRVLWEVMHNSHALLAFFALTNADVILARSLLSDQVSGWYAGGLILAKAVLFLPQFVVVIAFPEMAHPAQRRRMELRALGVVLVIGSGATAAAWLLGSWAVLFVGGAAYSELETTIWAFAAIGTLWAMEQLMVYSTVARQSRRTVTVIWVGLAVLVVGAQTVTSITGLLWLVAGVHVTVLGALVVLSQTAHRRNPAPV
jgi:O-antigen/teichoic acid export membrane protein